MGRSGTPSAKTFPVRRFCGTPRRRLNLQMLQADTAEPRAEQRIRRASPQLLLLLEENPLGILLDGVRDQDLTLDEPARIGDYDCYRV